MDGQEVGYTPTGIPFTYYGTRKLTLIKPGFKRRTELVAIPPPWYQWVPIDFVSDNFLGMHVADRHDINWQVSRASRAPRPVAATGRLSAIGSPHVRMTPNDQSKR